MSEPEMASSKETNKILLRQSMSVTENFLKFAVESKVPFAALIPYALKVGIAAHEGKYSYFPKKWAYT